MISSLLHLPKLSAEEAIWTHDLQTLWQSEALLFCEPRCNSAIQVPSCLLFQYFHDLAGFSFWAPGIGSFCFLNSMTRQAKKWNLSWYYDWVSYCAGCSCNLNGNFQWQSVKHAVVYNLALPHFHTSLFLCDVSQSSNQYHKSPRFSKVGISCDITCQHSHSSCVWTTVGDVVQMKNALLPQVCVLPCLVPSWNYCFEKMVYNPGCGVYLVDKGHQGWALRVTESTLAVAQCSASWFISIGVC